MFPQLSPSTSFSAYLISLGSFPDSFGSRDHNSTSHFNQQASFGVKQRKGLDQLNKQSVLQTHASMSLCELSANICAQSTPRINSNKPKSNYSPWSKNKDQKYEANWQRRVAAKSVMNDNRTSKRRQQKRFPSVFARLMGAQQFRSLQEKQESREAQILTVLRTRMDGARSQIKKAPLAQRKSLQQQWPSTIINLPNKAGKIYDGEEKTPTDAKTKMKTKVISSKEDKENRIVVIPKHNKKKYDDQYQSYNPLTKALYQRFMQTVNMNNKQSTCSRMITNSFLN